MELNKVYCMDNLELLKQLPDESIDLIYCDILYGTGRNFGEYKDIKSDKEIVFKFYVERIKEMHRVLSCNGSIVLQMDDRINHWIRNICDDIFGYKNFKNEIVWCYLSGGSTKKYFPKKHEYLIWYTKSDDYTFNVEYKEYSEKVKARNGCGFEKQSKGYGCKKEGTPIVDWWQDVEKVLNYKMAEYNGYPTQKSKKLLTRIISILSNEGDIVADFFMGSGTSMVVAKELGRNYIGCDINPRAVEITEKRLNNINN